MEIANYVDKVRPGVLSGGGSGTSDGLRDRQSHISELVAEVGTSSRSLKECSVPSMLGREAWLHPDCKPEASHSAFWG